MRFGTWNVRSLYKAGALERVASELTKYNSDLVAVRMVSLWAVVSQLASIYFSMKTGMLIFILGPGFSYIKESYQQ